jgi:hypothetical protein
MFSGFVIFFFFFIVEIFSATSVVRPRADVAYCIQTLSKRLSKTRNWIVMPLLLCIYSYFSQRFFFLVYILLLVSLLLVSGTHIDWILNCWEV